MLIASATILTSCAPLEQDLPGMVKTDEVLASNSLGIFMEACAKTVFRLSEATANAASSQGLRFFEGMSPPLNENSRNPYSEWKGTPILDDDGQPSHVSAMGAIGGCGELGNDYNKNLGHALAQKGNYYTLTQNEEGMIIVAPRSKLAAFLYFG